MKAVVANPNAPGSLEIGEIAEPVADSNEAVIAVTAFSLNRGELRRAEAAPAGTQIGWDLVEKAESPADSLFYRDILAARYLSDNAETNHFYLSQNGSESDSLVFGVIYPVAYPDVVEPAAESQLLLRYVNNLGAATGKNNQVVYVAFPLESMAEAERMVVFRYLMDYLHASD